MLTCTYLVYSKAFMNTESKSKGEYLFCNFECNDKSWQSIFATNVKGGDCWSLSHVANYYQTLSNFLGSFGQSSFQSSHTVKAKLCILDLLTF